MRHPFRRGQLVRTNDFYATVEHIDLRNTVIHTLTFYEGFGGDSIALTLRFWIGFHDREAEVLVARGDAVKRIKHLFDGQAARDHRKVGAGHVDGVAAEPMPARQRPTTLGTRTEQGPAERQEAGTAARGRRWLPGNSGYRDPRSIA